MSFVKLDCSILDSSIWWEKEQRDIFITALLMAVPFEVREPMPQYNEMGNPMKFKVPVGWYGFVEASGTGIIHRAMVEKAMGIPALEQLGAPDPDSKSKAYEGRRMVRVQGGFIILNFMEYRERDHTSAERSKRWREKKKREEARKYDLKPSPGPAPGELEHLKEGRRGNRRSVA